MTTFIPGGVTPKRRRAAMQASLWSARQNRLEKLATVAHVFSTLAVSSVVNGALSNGSLTFSGTTGIGGAMGSASHAPTTGKWYFEVTLGTKGDNGNGVDGFGVAGPTATAANLSTGVATHGCICYINSGDIYANGTHVGNVNGGSNNPTAGYVYGIGIDTGANTMQIQNLTTGGTLQTGIALPTELSLKPACCIDDNSSGSIYTFNFGATAFVGTLPSGYSAWG